MIDHLRSLVRHLVNVMDCERMEWDVARPFGEPARQRVRVDQGRVTTMTRRD
jgi:hypothetical protein